jgi:hypothetical protein
MPRHVLLVHLEGLLNLRGFLLRRRHRLPPHQAPIWQSDHWAYIAVRRDYSAEIWVGAEAPTSHLG